MSRNGSGTMVGLSNSWSPPVAGQLATAGDWQAIYADLIAALTQSLSRDGQGGMLGNLPMGNNKITGLADGTGSGQALTFSQLFDQGTEQDLASAATTDIGAQLTNFLRITGTTTITSFGTNYKGPRFLRFAGAVTLTNSSTLVLPGGANITTAAGDCIVVVPKATLGTADGWQVVGYQKNANPTVVTPSAGSVTNATLADGAVYGTKLTSKIEPVTASVTSNALTVTLNPTTLDFRSSTLGSGTVNTRTVATAISAVVPSGATLGTANSVASKVMLLAIDNAGTVELAVCNGSLALDESTLISTTVLDTAADSASVIYSTTARTNVPFRIVGYVESTQSTAGTWASSPSKIQGIGGQIQSATASGSGGGITSGTAVTASGTSVDFTSIPAGVKRITVMFQGVSTSGSSIGLVQLGVSGTPQTSGYTGTYGDYSTTLTSSAISQTGFPCVSGASSSYVANGHLTLCFLKSDVWSISSTLSSNPGRQAICYGTVSLSGTLNMIRLTTVNGTDTYDAGSINILLE